MFSLGDRQYTKTFISNTKHAVYFITYIWWQSYPGLSRKVTHMRFRLTENMFVSYGKQMELQLGFFGVREIIACSILFVIKDELY